MRTINIPRADWNRKLDEFSQIHDGWRVSLDVLMSELGAQPEFGDLPLRGVTAEVGERESTVTIAAMSTDQSQITHTIHNPGHIRLAQNEAGADVALEIESADGTIAILRFTSPALPETVDGVPRRS